jgi:glucosamine-6-phosphate deaminase
MEAATIHTEKVDHLTVHIFPSNESLGKAAASMAAGIISAAIEAKGFANLILATGNSQLTFLNALKNIPCDWSRVTIFHMDEYIGIDPQHPASFPNFLQKHLIDFIKPKQFFPLSTEVGEIEVICQDYETLLRAHPADLCALGIGENGHLAFNDPPYADFEDSQWVKIVQLDEASRQQQVGEGHFHKIDEVPTHAITLTIPALLSAKNVFAIVPEARKAEAVFGSLTLDINACFPATILRKIRHAQLFVDLDSAANIFNQGKVTIP